MHTSMCCVHMTNGMCMCMCTLCPYSLLKANVPEDPRDLDAVAAFPRALANHSPTFAFSGTKYCADPAKAGTGRRALAEMLPSVHCYTLEVSFFCSANGNIRGEAYTPASYTDMGQSMALALHEYYSGLETPTDASWHKYLQAPGQVIMASRQTGSSAIQLHFPVHEGACIEPDTHASRQQAPGIKADTPREGCHTTYKQRTCP